MENQVKTPTLTRDHVATCFEALDEWHGSKLLKRIKPDVYLAELKEINIFEARMLYYLWSPPHVGTIPERLSIIMPQLDGAWSKLI